MSFRGTGRPGIGAFLLLAIGAGLLVSGGDDEERPGPRDGRPRAELRQPRDDGRGGRERAPGREAGVGGGVPHQGGGGGRGRGGGPPSPPAGVAATVVRVIDGDTVEVSIGGREQDVRYIGVDTPETVAPGEPVECFGPQASDYNHRRVEGERVRLVFDDERRDYYGRLLAYVYLAGDLVNADLVRLGYARTLAIAPNTDRAGLFDRLEQRAARAGRGLWGRC